MEFEQKIEDLRKELAALRQEKLKSATTLKMHGVEVPLAFNLELVEPFLYPIVRSDKYAILTVTAEDESEFLSMLTFNVEEANDRFYITTRTATGNQTEYYIRVRSFNTEDESALEGGGTITLNTTATISASTEISVSVRYEDLYPE